MTETREQRRHRRTMETLRNHTKKLDKRLSPEQKRKQDRKIHFDRRLQTGEDKMVQRKDPEVDAHLSHIRKRTV